MASDLRGDPTAALLEVLDLSLNHEFRDAYTELPLDLSNVFFIATANTLEGIPLPLMDRMEIIELESYSRQEKLGIATKYLLPKQRKEYGLKVYQLKLSQDGAGEDHCGIYKRGRRTGTGTSDRVPYAVRRLA